MRAVAWREIKGKIFFSGKRLMLQYNCDFEIEKEFYPLALVIGWKEKNVLIGVHDPGESPLELRPVIGKDPTIESLPWESGEGYITETESLGFAIRERAIDMAALAWESGLNIHIAGDRVIAWAPSRPNRQLLFFRVISLDQLRELLPVLNRFATNVKIGSEPALAIFDLKRTNVQEFAKRLDPILLTPWGSFSENISDPIMLKGYSKPAYRIGGEALYRIIPRLRYRVRKMLSIEKRGKIPCDRAPFSCPDGWDSWLPCPRATPMMKKAIFLSDEGEAGET